MDKFILHSSHECPYSIRTRIVLELKKIPYELIEERRGDWSDFLRNNLENPTVPVLLHEDKIIREANIINEYLEQIVAQPALVPANYEDKEVMRLWWRWCDGLFKPAIDQFRYLDDNEFHLAGKVKLERLFNVLEQELIKYQNLVNATLSLADIAVIPFVRQALLVQKDPLDITRYPRLQAWSNQILEADFFKQNVMRHHPFIKPKPTKRF